MLYAPVLRFSILLQLRRPAKKQRAILAVPSRGPCGRESDASSGIIYGAALRSLGFSIFHVSAALSRASRPCGASGRLHHFPIVLFSTSAGYRKLHFPVIEVFGIFGGWWARARKKSIRFVLHRSLRKHDVEIIHWNEFPRPERLSIFLTFRAWGHRVCTLFMIAWVHWMTYYLASSWNINNLGQK